LSTFDIELTDGRNFDRNLSTDQGKAYLLNESAVAALGWQSAVGKELEVLQYKSERGKVVGVIKDFHFQSLRDPIKTTCS